MGMNEEKRHYVLEIRERMEARGLYDESLEPAIGVLAGLLCRLDTIRESIAEEGTMLTVVSREGNPRTILNPAGRLRYSVRRRYGSISETSVCPWRSLRGL